ncbi:hypothetical protein D9M68_514220 [compost metagenome]
MRRFRLRLMGYLHLVVVGVLRCACGGYPGGALYGRRSGRWGRWVEVVSSGRATSARGQANRLPEGRPGCSAPFHAGRSAHGRRNVAGIEAVGTTPDGACCMGWEWPPDAEGNGWGSEHATVTGPAVGGDGCRLRPAQPTAPVIDGGGRALLIMGSAIFRCALSYDSAQFLTGGLALVNAGVVKKSLKS